MTSPENLERAKIVILGAGPTGLGAAHRLQELGIPFKLFEKELHAGGLASSFVDSNGFTWDIGGHVQFSHYSYFDDLMDKLLGEEWLHHEREA
jgi:protoporphyrinogen oxidase